MAGDKEQPQEHKPEKSTLYWGTPQPQGPDGKADTYTVVRNRLTSRELDGTSVEVSGSVFAIGRRFSTPEEFGTTSVKITHVNGQELLPDQRRTIYLNPVVVFPVSEITQTRSQQVWIKTRTGGLEEFNPAVSGFIFLEGQNPYNQDIRITAGRGEL